MLQRGVFKDLSLFFGMVYYSHMDCAKRRKVFLLFLSVGIIRYVCAAVPYPVQEPCASARSQYFLCAHSHKLISFRKSNHSRAFCVAFQLRYSRADEPNARKNCFLTVLLSIQMGCFVQNWFVYGTPSQQIETQ